MQIINGAASENNSSDNRALTIIEYGRHPAAEIFPEMDADALAVLAANIAAEGLDDPIVLHEDAILKGWSRYQACKASGTPPRFRHFDADREGDPKAFVLRQALLRKHLEKTQRAMIAARLVTSTVGFNRTNEGTTIVGAAKIANVTAKMVERALTIHRSSPMVADAVANGRIPTIRTAKTLSKLPESIQRSVLAGNSSGPALKKDIQAAFRNWKAAQPVCLPEGRYAVIVADPPWPVDKAPYPTMRPGQIEIDLGWLLKSKAAEDCHLFLWTTQAHLPDALLIIGRLGWTYKFTMTWRKNNGPQNPNGPMYNDEFVVVATKGAPSFVDTRDFKTGFEGAKRGHSEKPEEFFDTIRRVTTEPRIELYARVAHEGFDAHGNEVRSVSPAECPSAAAHEEMESAEGAL